MTPELLYPEAYRPAKAKAKARATGQRSKKRVERNRGPRSRPEINAKQPLRYEGIGNCEVPL
jgi:hypothetical protein